MSEVIVPAKAWYLSKTIWVNVLGVVALIIPQSAAIIGEHFAIAGIGWSFINLVLRAVTKGKIELS
jgi:hypothetical protein